MEPSNEGLTPLYARLLLGLVKPFPDFDFSFIKPMRKRAVRSLRLKPGDRVLDVGCGMGGSFPFLAEAVGPSGEVLGVEISPQAVASARRRIDKNGWPNVQVVQAAAETVSLSGIYDALLMFAAPDVYASEAALANILPHLKAGSRIVFFGAKRSQHRVAGVLNALLKQGLSRLSFATTPLPDDEPWRLVAATVKEFEVEEFFFGTMFLASGSLARTATSA
jgi:protein-L-isoaspartate O-methyltransferase